jgi:hypothetical protein
MHRFRPRLTYANVVSTLCLFIVLGGGAYAATQLPSNSVGTPQLKADAVTSPKIKNGTIVGADVNKAKLGKVPLAAHADNATNAANANRVGGKLPSDFVGATAQAGGGLQGPFSNLTLRPDAVGGPQVASESLNQSDISDFKTTNITLADPVPDGLPVVVPFDDAGAPSHFVYEASCNNTGGGLFGSILVTNTNGSFNSDGTGSGAERDQVAVPKDTRKLLIQLGPVAGHHFATGSWTTQGSSLLMGLASVEVDNTGKNCHVGLTRFG